MARQNEGPWFRKSKGTWYVSHSGRQQSLGVRGESNKREALRAWHRLMASTTASSPLPLPAPAKPEPSRQDETVPTVVTTVEAVSDAFLVDAGKRCKHESMAVYKSTLTRFAAQFGPRHAMGMRPHEVERFATRDDWSASTQNTFLSAIVTAFRWAVRSGMLTANPLEGLRKPPCGSRGASSALSQEQFEKLQAAAPQAFRSFLLGLWLTGCRPGELASLSAGDVDFRTGIAVLTEHKTARKTGKPRFIYLSPDALKLFKAVAAEHPEGPLFRNSWDNAWNRFTLQKAMAAARTKAGLSNSVVCYSLRHSYATAALGKGVPDATVAALLGHTGTAMLHRHYSHLTSQTTLMRAAAARVHGIDSETPSETFA